MILNLKLTLLQIEEDKLGLLDQIKELVKYLPTKDYNISLNKIKERDFTDLYHLVKSSIIIIAKDRKKEIQKYSEIDLDALNILMEKIEQYNKAING